ncbi:MAG: ArsA family ATPase [Deltaproteobacteria bacterium]|nr:ArsA family ATPase [Deltaproteobacteria bacterium]
MSGHPLTSAQILLTCGTGGVGKTTMAVVLGLAAAHAGRRVLVLTIDPARRLANALGLEAFDDAVHPVWPRPPDSAAKEGGSLDCAMLDVKRTFDRVVRQYAPSAESAEAILGNPLYQQLAGTITGSQEYMAMERLYELTETAHPYELIILDTPPTHQALDFFRAPQRMVNALTGSMLQLFVKPAAFAGKIGARLLAHSSDTLLKFFGKITGVDLLREISALIVSAVSLFDGFRERAAAVDLLLRDPRSQIVLVTTPNTEQLLDARAFLHSADSLGMHVGGIILNRVTPDFPLPASIPAPTSPIEHHVVALGVQLAAQRRADLACRDQLCANIAEAIPLWLMPAEAHEITNLEDLTRLAHLYHHE